MKNYFLRAEFNVKDSYLCRIRLLLFFIAISGIAFFITSCDRTKEVAGKHYPITGRVVSIDAQDQSAIIDGDAIPGFMDAMAMPYKIKPASALNQLSPGDSITGEVVVVQPQDKNAAPDYWVENLKVTGHAKTQSSVTPGAAQHIPAPGDPVPDFHLINQDGRQISLQRYRDKVLLVTFIYTRCPFPDFCPRMSGHFAEIHKQITSKPALSNVQLLTISFDPEHDTPKVLRDYGFSVAHTHDAALFSQWEFAVPSAADLPKIAAYFGLIYKPEGGMITHNLSTAVIGPDGKIAKWYHGGDWQVSDLIKDASDARAPHH